MMKIIYKSEPFFHTIFYDFFDPIEVTKILIEINQLSKMTSSLSTIDEHDQHHIELYEKGKTRSYCLDQLHKDNRKNSFILNMITKIYEMDRSKQLDYKANPFLNYIKFSNQDNTFVNIYKNQSFYQEHVDGAVLTFLYVFYEEPKAYTGGNLSFPEYNYTPELLNNSCVIFPSFERHLVTKMIAPQGVNRFTINQRIWVKN